MEQDEKDLEQQRVAAGRHVEDVAAIARIRGMATRMAVWTETSAPQAFLEVDYESISGILHIMCFGMM